MNAHPGKKSAAAVLSFVSCFAASVYLHADDEKALSGTAAATSGLIAAAKEGDESAIAILLNRPLATPDGKPDVQLLNWFRDAAQKGNGRAMCRIADAYQLGVGTQKNYETAMKWYEHAADSGEPCGMAGIGWMYFHGHGVPEDPQAAFKWYRRWKRCQVPFLVDRQFAFGSDWLVGDGGAAFRSRSGADFCLTGGSNGVA